MRRKSLPYHEQSVRQCRADRTRRAALAGALAVAAMFGLASCAGVEQLDRRIDSAMKRRGLLPRVEQIGDETEARRDQRCQDKPLPGLHVIQHDVFPSRVEAGTHANHRFTYVLCPRSGGEPLSADLIRRVNHKGHQVMSDVTRHAELKPGIWRVDAFFEIPPSAPAGAYEVEVQFTHPNAGFHERTGFSIVPRATAPKP